MWVERLLALVLCREHGFVLRDHSCQYLWGTIWVTGIEPDQMQDKCPACYSISKPSFIILNLKTGWFLQRFLFWRIPLGINCSLGKEEPESELAGLFLRY